MNGLLLLTGVLFAQVAFSNSFCGSLFHQDRGVAFQAEFDQVYLVPAKLGYFYVSTVHDGDSLLAVNATKVEVVKTANQDQKIHKRTLFSFDIPTKTAFLTETFFNLSNIDHIKSSSSLDGPWVNVVKYHSQVAGVWLIPEPKVEGHVAFFSHNDGWEWRIGKSLRFEGERGEWDQLAVALFDSSVGAAGESFQRYEIRKIYFAKGIGEIASVVRSTEIHLQNGARNESEWILQTRLAGIYENLTDVEKLIAQLK